MIQLSTAIVLFSAVLGLVRLVQIKKGFSYTDHFLKFVLVYVVGIMLLIGGMFVSDFTHLPLDGFWILIFTFFAYLIFSHVWRKRVDVGSLYKQQTLLGVHIDMLEHNKRYTTVKFFEIVFQDIAAFLVVTSLYNFGLSVLFISVLFALIAFVLHLGTPVIFGKFYGGYFLACATVISLMIPGLLLEVNYGFYILIIIHVISYVAMLFLSKFKSEKPFK